MAGLNAGTPASTIFAGNLAYELSEQQLIDYFSQVGPVKNIRIVTDRETGKPRGFGFIEFYDIPTAESAIRNLNGSELMGRAMRIVFAEGGPPGSGDFRPRREDDRYGDDRGRRLPPRARMVGADLAYHAAQGMSTLLGESTQPGAPADAITATLARKTRSELWEYMSQMKTLVQQNAAQARQILVQNPQLMKALFQMEIILGLVANPLGDIAPKGAAPLDMLPQRGQPQYTGQIGGALPGPAQQQPVMTMEQPSTSVQPALPQHQLLQQPPQAVQLLPQQPSGSMQLPVSVPGVANGLPMPSYQPAGAPIPAPVMQVQPGLPASGYVPGPSPPHAHSFAPQSQSMPTDPRMVNNPIDPRSRTGQAAAPPQAGFMVSTSHNQPQQLTIQPVQQGQEGQPLTPEMQQALLQQVMSLTQQQIELLPPQQKAQVLALQQQLRGQA